MADLRTSYMGIPLANPVVVAACSLSNRVDRIQAIEAAGAGALVIRSLFEEEILHDQARLEEELGVGAEAFAEALTYFPPVEHGGPKSHLMWVRRTREAVKMPLIGSLNATNPGTWTDYARQLVDAGVDAIELNTYAVEADANRTAQEVEDRLLATVTAVREAVSVPVAVKLSPYYSVVGHVVARLAQAGINGVVLFNKFWQPDIDLARQAFRPRVSLSTREDLRLPLRWIALLAGQVKLDLIANSGVMDGGDVARALLAGAAAVQVASTLYRNKIEHLGVMVKGLEAWMDAQGYADLAACRGRLSQQQNKMNAAMYERAQYFDFLTRLDR